MPNVKGSFLLHPLLIIYTPLKKDRIFGLFSFFDEVCRILSKPTYVGGVSTFFHFIITKKSQIPLESDSVKIYYLIPYANKSTLAPAAE